MRQSIENNGNQDPTPTIHPADERRERIGAEVLAHMYAKYGVEFNIRGHDWDRHRDRLTLYPVWGTFEGERVDVQRRVVDGGVVFSDSYFGIMIREDVEAEVLGMLSEVDLPMKAFYNRGTSSFDNMFDGTKTFADLRQWRADEGIPWSPIIALVVSYDGDKENHEAVAEKIFDALIEKGFRGLVGVAILPDEVFAKATRINRDELYREFSESVTIRSRNISPQGGN